MISIRNATIEDAPFLSNNNILMAKETEDRHLNPDTVLQGVIMLLSNPLRGRYLIAETGGKAVGQCMLTYEWSDWRCGDFWWIQSVYVDPEFRRRGIFTMLYRYIIKMAEEAEFVTGVRLYVEKENNSAQLAYVNLGMTRVPYSMFECDFTT